MAGPTLIAKCEAAENTGQLAAALAMQTRINGGSSDTEVKEFAVKPTRSAATLRVVMIVTPVANQPSASRKARWSTELMRER